MSAVAEQRRIEDRRRLLPRAGGRRADDPQALWLSISAYARVFDVSRPTVYKWMEHGLVDFCEAARIVRIRNAPPRNSKV